MDETLGSGSPGIREFVQTTKHRSRGGATELIFSVTTPQQDSTTKINFNSIKKNCSVHKKVLKNQAVKARS